MPSIHEANSHERGPTQEILIKEQAELRQTLAALEKRIKEDPTNGALLVERASLKAELIPMDADLMEDAA